MLNITWLGSISAIQGIGSSVQRVISHVVINRAVWTIDVETIARAATASSKTTATKEQRATAETTPTKSAAWASETSWNKTTGATARTTGATARTTGSSLAAETSLGSHFFNAIAPFVATHVCPVGVVDVAGDGYGLGCRRDLAPAGR